jgi:transcriptional regulator with XRE-family HTH domain
MGRSRRPRPGHLAAKLRQIRAALGLTQDQMFERLGETRTALYPGHISLYESGQREPPLPVLLRYARSAGVYVDVLIDDELVLPDRLPIKTNSAASLKRFKKASGKKSSSKIR